MVACAAQFDGAVHVCVNGVADLSTTHAPTNFVSSRRHHEPRNDSNNDCNVDNDDNISTATYYFQNYCSNESGTAVGGSFESIL